MNAAQPCVPKSALLKFEGFVCVQFWWSPHFRVAQILIWASAEWMRFVVFQDSFGFWAGPKVSDTLHPLFRLYLLRVWSLGEFTNFPSRISQALISDPFIFSTYLLDPPSLLYGKKGKKSRQSSTSGGMSANSDPSSIHFLSETKRGLYSPQIYFNKLSFDGRPNFCWEFRGDNEGFVRRERERESERERERERESEREREESSNL